MSRTGLGRHGNIDESAGDPLDGLVNLFDVGIVLAVAFLIASLTVATTKSQERPEPSKPSSERRARTVPNPATAPPAKGRGTEVGKVYRLADGRLVYVEEGGP